MMEEGLIGNTVHDIVTQEPITVVNQKSKLQKGLAVSAAGVSIIAVMVVPYLVLRSVFYLATRQENFTFEEMIHTDKTVFWIFGPSGALLATIAIAPFNMYNAYKTVINIQFTQKGLSLTHFVRMLSGIFLTFTGAVNGYNTNAAIDDILPNSSTIKEIIRYPVVGVGVLFAGVSDARVFLDYLAKDLSRDWRYIKRGGHLTYHKMRKGVLFFNKQPDKYMTLELTRKELLKQIRNNLDDLSVIIQLALTDTELNQFLELYKNKDWLNDIHSTELETYLQLFSKQFPIGRYIGSEIFGSTLAGLWSYYGNKNTYEYTFKAVSGFLSYCGLSANNSFLKFMSNFTSVTSYITGFFVSFFLIRDLFFRDIFKATTWAEIKERLPKLIIPLIPALSFGLLNVILSVLNDSLSPVDKVIVSCSAIIGATVVTRYGIEGGINEIKGESNVRHGMVYITDELMKHYSALNDDELKQIRDKIVQIRDSLQSKSNPQNDINIIDKNGETSTTEYVPHPQ